MKNKLLKIALAIIIAVLFTSCGSRKVNKEVNKESVKEKTSVITNKNQKDSSYIVTDEKLRLAIEKSTFNFEPIDNTKPFFIGSQKYENVKVVSSNEKENREEDKTKIEAYLKEIENYTTFINELEKEVYSKNRQVERFTYWGLGIGIFLVLLVLLILWYFDKKVRQIQNRGGFNL